MNCPEVIFFHSQLSSTEHEIYPEDKSEFFDILTYFIEKLKTASKSFKERKVVIHKPFI